MKELSGIWIFALKALIVVSFSFAAVIVSLPNTKALRESWNSFFSQRENRALVFSFIQNPVALIMSGERDIEQKNYEEAALKFELAVGLLEMHDASASTMKPYLARLKKAQQLAAQVRAVAPDLKGQN